MGERQFQAPVVRPVQLVVADRQLRTGTGDAMFECPPRSVALDETFLPQKTQRTDRGSQPPSQAPVPLAIRVSSRWTGARNFLSCCDGEVLEPRLRQPSPAPLTR